MTNPKKWRRHSRPAELCPLCGKPIPKFEKADHRKTWHSECTQAEFDKLLKRAGRLQIGSVFELPDAKKRAASIRPGKIKTATHVFAEAKRLNRRVKGVVSGGAIELGKKR